MDMSFSQPLPTGRRTRVMLEKRTRWGVYRFVGICWGLVPLWEG